MIGDVVFRDLTLEIVEVAPNAPHGFDPGAMKNNADHFARLGCKKGHWYGYRFAESVAQAPANGGGPREFDAP